MHVCVEWADAGRLQQDRKEAEIGYCADDEVVPPSAAMMEDVPPSPPQRQKTDEAPAMIQQGLPLLDPADPSKALQGQSTMNCFVMRNTQLIQKNNKPATSRGGGGRAARVSPAAAQRSRTP